MSPERPAPAPAGPAALHAALDAIWRPGAGWRWFAVTNHSAIGMRFIVTALVFFTIGGLLAMLIRVQLASAASPFMEPGLYAQVFTMHGTIMMFLFAIPFFEGFAMYLLPKLLGARDMAFPRLSAYGWWCYVLGGSILIAALIGGVAPDAGWFMYTPLSSATWSPGINADVWLLGITFVEISALCAAVEIVVTVLKVRAPGMSLGRMPIFGWYMLVVGAMMLLGFPPLILGSILLEAERAFGLPFFDPTRGGDPLLWQHLFWLFGHPEVYIIFLPAAGAVSTILPVFAGRPLAGYRIVVAALVAMGFLSFGLWVHHMYTVGLPHMSLAFFSAASALVAVPTAVQIFAWLATLAHGRPRFSLPMLHIFGFFFVFVMGGLTGVMLAMVPFDWQAHDTHFVVAHLHYVLVGGFLFPMMAAGYYWLPLFTGRQVGGPLARAAFWLVFAGFNGTFFLMHLTGLLGMPRRIHTSAGDPVWEALNLVSSVGSFVMAAGFGLMLIDLVLTLRFGPRAKPDPWQARTLDWAVPKLPPPAYNFAALPQIGERADRLFPRAIAGELAAGRGYLGAPRNGWMETAVVGAMDGRLEQILILPRQSFLPFLSALATGAVFVAMLFKLYWLALALFVALPAVFLLWPGGDHARTDHGSLDAGMGERAPLHTEHPRPPSYWAMGCILSADAALYAALLFGGLFLWLSAPGWPPPDMPPPGLAAQAMAAAGALVAAFAGRRAEAAGPRGAGWLALCIAGHGLAVAGWAALALALPAPSGHAAYATVVAVAAYAGLHAAIGAVLAGAGLGRLMRGHVSGRRRTDLRLGRLWHGYCLGAGLVALGYLHALQALAGGGP